MTNRIDTYLLNYEDLIKTNILVALLLHWIFFDKLIYRLIFENLLEKKF